MKKRRLRVFCTLLCLLCLAVPLCAAAAPIDTATPCELTLTYEKGGTAFAGLDIRLYRVADLTADGTFQKVAPFDRYPVEVAGITSQAEWNEVAFALNGYAQADRLTPTNVQTTDQNGNAVFSGLAVGLYLVGGVVTEAGGVTYTFYDSMLCLPEIADNTCRYTVTAKPKSTLTPPANGETVYTVSKLWKDEGNSDKRPVSVTVDVLKNGTPYKTVTLHAENGWTHSFSDSDKNVVWAVVEREVPAGYTVQAVKNGTAFLVINTWEDTTPKDPPLTGETTPLGLWIALTCISGLLFLVLGIGTGRKAYAQDK